MLSFIFGIINVCVLGWMIGLERKRSSNIIGMRTCILVMLGSYLFSCISVSIGDDPARVIAQIVCGLGFLGGGIIIKNGINDIRHLTTAVLIWVLAAIGCLIALGSIWEAYISACVVYIILRLRILKDENFLSYFRRKYNNIRNKKS